MYAGPWSGSPADVKSPLEDSHPDEIQLAIYETDHVVSAFDSIDEAERSFEVVHDHCGFAALAFANRLDTPLVHMVHGPSTPEIFPFHERHARKAPVIALSRYQASQAPESLGRRPADADSLGRAVRSRHDRGDGLRDPGDCLSRGSASELVVDGETGFLVSDQ